MKVKQPTTYFNHKDVIWVVINTPSMTLQQRVLLIMTLRSAGYVIGSETLDTHDDEYPFIAKNKDRTSHVTETRSLHGRVKVNWQRLLKSLQDDIKHEKV